MCCLVALFALPLYANAAAFGDISVQSYLGEPLRARINVVAGHDEEIGSLCFNVMGSGDPNAINSSYRVSVTDTRLNRYLQIDGNQPQTEPALALRLRAGCLNQSSTTREYAILLDPRPAARPATPVAVVTAPVADPPRSASVSVPTVYQAPVYQAAVSDPYWIVRAGDTPRSIAQGIYPKSRARQAAYIAALKKLNPEIESIPNQGALPEGLPLAMPDLRTLSLARVSPTPADLPTRSETAPRPRATKSQRPTGTSVAQVSPAPVTRSVARVATGDAKFAMPTRELNKNADGFQLKLSSADIDLTRSAGVTEEARAKLREKLQLIDLDDHVAKLLALKDTMRQMEARLSSLQTKIATPSAGASASASASTLPASVSAPASTPVSAPATAPTATAGVASTSATPNLTPMLERPIVKSTTPVAAPSPVVTAAPAKPVSPPSAPSSSTIQPATVAAAASPAVASAANDDAPPAARRIPVVKTAPPSKLDAFLADPMKSLGLDPTIGFSALAALLAALGGAYWWFRRPAKPYDPGHENALISAARKESLAKSSHGEAVQQPAAGRFEEWAEEKSAMEQLRATSADPAADKKAPPKRVLEDTNSLLRKAAATGQTGPHATVPSVDPTSTLILEPLAKSSQHTIDVPLDQGAPALDLRLETEDTPKVDRAQRLKYMHDRYPELASKVASVEDPSTLINLARTYFREGYRVKACELLTYGIEERPQEIRYWLAQFEIFRLENLLPAFNTLARKFQVLFGSDEAWAKVQHVGSVLDPSDELYHRNLDDPYPNSRFDPLVDNWLNTPSDSPVEPLSNEPPRLFGDALLTPQNIENISMRLSTLPTIKPS